MSVIFDYVKQIQGPFLGVFLYPAEHHVLVLYHLLHKDTLLQMK